MMVKWTTLHVAVAVVAVLASCTPSMAASPPGASSCSGCHAGSATSSSIPGINGRNADDTMAAMIAFRDGTQPATVMNRIAKGFSDDELRAIAAWLATQK